MVDDHKEPPLNHWGNLLLDPPRATRNTTGLNGIQTSMTAFQLFSCKESKVIDLTERRLIKLIKLMKDEVRKVTLVALLKDYRDGHVAIAWKKAEPQWILVTKEK